MARGERSCWAAKLSKGGEVQGGVAANSADSVGELKGREGGRWRRVSGRRGRRDGGRMAERGRTDGLCTGTTCSQGRVVADMRLILDYVHVWAGILRHVKRAVTS